MVGEHESGGRRMFRSSVDILKNGRQVSFRWGDRMCYPETCGEQTHAFFLA